MIGRALAVPGVEPAWGLQPEQLLLPDPLEPSLAQQDLRILMCGGAQPLHLGEYQDPERVRFLRFDEHYPLPGGSFREACATHLPAGWEPDYVVFYWPDLAVVPPDLHECPWPTVAVLGDWNLAFRDLLPVLGGFDLVLADANGVDRLRAAGVANSHFFPAYSYNPAMTPRFDGKDLDVAFVGNLAAGIHGVRNRYLAEVAKLAGRYRISLDTAVYGDAYIERFQRAKVVFNHSVRGELNLRACEAPACGAVLFLEATNREAPVLLRPDVDAVYYADAEDLRAKLVAVLADDARREAIARSGSERVRRSSYTARFSALLSLMKRAFSAPDAPRRAGPDPVPWKHLLAHARRAHRSFDRARLPHELALLDRAAHAGGGAAFARDSAAVAAVLADAETDPERRLRARAHARLRFRLAGDAGAGSPPDPVLALNLARFLVDEGEFEAARDPLRTVLGVPAASADGMSYPARYDHLATRLEAAYAAHLDDARAREAALARVLRWAAAEQLGALAAGPDEARQHFARAASELPDVGETQAKLGLATLDAGDPEAAIPALVRARALDPFQWAAVRALIVAYGRTGRREAGYALYREAGAVLRGVPAFAAEQPALDAAFAQHFPLVPGLRARNVLLRFAGVGSLAAAAGFLRGHGPEDDVALVVGAGTGDADTVVQELLAVYAAEGLDPGAGPEVVVVDRDALGGADPAELVWLVDEVLG